MKKYIFLFIAFTTLLFSCGKTANVKKIETSKSGTIDTTIVNNEKLTPLYGVTDKSIVDDGFGYHQIKVDCIGDGEVTVSSEKAKAGETINFSIKLDKYHKLDAVYVNSDCLDKAETSFVMPDKDVTFQVFILDKRYSLRIEAFIVADTLEIVEGEKFYFGVSIDDPDNYYYEDSDIKCYYYDLEDQQQFLTLTKESDGRYSAIAPSRDVYVAVRRHYYRAISDFSIYSRSNKYDYHETEEDKNSFNVVFTCNNKAYSFDQKVKESEKIRVKFNTDKNFVVEQVITYMGGYIVDYKYVGENEIEIDTSTLKSMTDTLVFQIGYAHNITINDSWLVLSYRNTFNYRTIDGKALYGQPFYVWIAEGQSFSLKGLVVKTIDDEPVEVTDYGDGSFGFEMPDKDIIVSSIVG